MSNIVIVDDRPIDHPAVVAKRKALWDSYTSEEQALIKKMASEMMDEEKN